MSNDILKLSVELLKKCPICGERCTTNEGHILETEEDHSVTYFQCDACLSGFMMHLSHYPFGVVGSVLLTDLKYQEVERFHNQEAINEDDVLEVHTALSDQNVDTLFMNNQ